MAFCILGDMMFALHGLDSRARSAAIGRSLADLCVEVVMSEKIAGIVKVREKLFSSHRTTIIYSMIAV
jgi:hypothetical protein